MGLIALAIGVTTTPVLAQQSGVSCREMRIPVSLLGLPQSMYGKLCEPGVPTRTVLLLIPGGGYDSRYWDLPSEAGLHSFRAGMNAAGYATLIIDRVGTGRSSRPLLSATMTATGQAHVMHQTVGKLRTGALGPRYDKVVIGGHSLGATISIIEAANYRDVDGVLVASIVHRLDAVDLALDGLLSFVPAALDPVLASRGYDLGYLTTRVGTRERAFHNPAIPTPQAIAHDESTKDAFAVTEAADGIGVGILTPYSALVDVPVLIAMGGHDKLFCSPLAADCSSAEALHAQEAPFYSSAARLETYLLPGNYGHSFNYAPNADEFHRRVADWANRRIGR